MEGHIPVSWRFYWYMGSELAGADSCSNKVKTRVSVIYIVTDLPGTEAVGED